MIEYVIKWKDGDGLAHSTICQVPKGTDIKEWARNNKPFDSIIISIEPNQTNPEGLT